MHFTGQGLHTPRFPALASVDHRALAQHRIVQNSRGSCPRRFPGRALDQWVPQVGLFERAPLNAPYPDAVHVIAAYAALMSIEGRPHGEMLVPDRMGGYRVESIRVGAGKQQSNRLDGRRHTEAFQNSRHVQK